MFTSHRTKCFYYIILEFIVLIRNIQCEGSVVYAINCGGDEHYDYNHIIYKKDPLDGLIGTASDFGRRLLIGRVHPQDQILYQTERYHDSNFGYDIPIKDDGNYVLVLKFSEVYFNEIDRKVFDIKLNNYHTVVPNLDIFDKVGRGVAHDEYIPFRVTNGRLFIHNEQSDVVDGAVYLEFIKGYRDNPKINAFYLMKGTLDDVPRLPAIDLDIPEEEYKDVVFDEAKRNRRPSGPALPDPYTVDDSSMMLPILIAVGAFIPILFCLCKL